MPSCFFGGTGLDRKEVEQRFAVGMLTITGAMLLTIFNLIGAGVSGGDRAYAAGMTAVVMPAVNAFGLSIMAFIVAELVDNPKLRHILFRVFTYLTMLCIAWAGFLLIAKAGVKLP